MNTQYIVWVSIFFATALNGMENTSLPDRETALTLFKFAPDSRPSGKKIKRRYRRLALKIHPDKNGNTSEATEKFQAFSNAYELLKMQLSSYPPRASAPSSSTEEPFMPQEDFDLMVKQCLDSGRPDGFVYRNYRDLSLDNLMRLAQQADNSGSKPILDSLIKLWVWKQFKANNNVKSKDLVALGASQNISEVIGYKYVLVEFQLFTRY